MKLTINNTSINILECKDNYDYNLNELVVKINKSEIEDEVAFKTLFRTNTGDIIIVNDNDSTMTYCGYTQYVKFTDDDEMYTVYCGALPKTEKKVAELTSALDAEKNKVLELQSTANAQSITIDELIEYQAEMLYELSLLELGITE